MILWLDEILAIDAVEGPHPFTPDRQACLLDKRKGNEDGLVRM